jgi:ubiquinone/menaquinone biosynthesis C-methylase UbiE
MAPPSFFSTAEGAERAGQGILTFSAVRCWRWLLRLGFRLLYNELAWTYDLVSWLVSFGQWRTWQRASLRHLVGDRCLELAFGTGNLLADMYAAGGHPSGVELSPHMVGITRRKMRRWGLSLPLVRGRVQALPFLAGAFDSAVSTFPTEFIIEPATLAEVHRVLKPGGRLVIVDRCQLLGRGLLSRFVEWLYVVTGQRVEPRPGLVEHLQGAGFIARRADEEIAQSLVGVVLGEKLEQEHCCD